MPLTLTNLVVSRNGRDYITGAEGLLFQPGEYGPFTRIMVEPNTGARPVASVEGHYYDIAGTLAAVPAGFPDFQLGFGNFCCTFAGNRAEFRM